MTRIGLFRLGNQNLADKMGVVFLLHPGGLKYYCCSACDAPLTSKEELERVLNLLKFCLKNVCKIVLRDKFFQLYETLYKKIFLKIKENRIFYL